MMKIQSTFSLLLLLATTAPSAQGLSCWSGASFSAAITFECSSGMNNCISYTYKCQQGDTTCKAGTPFETATCGDDSLCAQAKLLPDASNVQCCQTDNCNGAALIASAKNAVCVPDQGSSAGASICGDGPTKCASYSFMCAADDTACKPEEVGKIKRTTVCATDELCAQITDPLAAAYYINATCVSGDAAKAKYTTKAGDTPAVIGTTTSAKAGSDSTTKDGSASTVAVAASAFTVAAFAALSSLF
jgi:hypothetical protein